MDIEINFTTDEDLLIFLIIVETIIFLEVGWNKSILINYLIQNVSEDELVTPP